MEGNEAPRRVYKAAHRKQVEGDRSLRVPAITGEIVDDSPPPEPLPPDVERLWVIVAQTGLTVGQAARRIGMSEERARQIASTRMWADAMRHGLAEAGVTPMTVGALLAGAMKATYPKFMKGKDGKKTVVYVEHWGARMNAIKAYLNLNLELAKIERLPDGDIEEPVVRRQLIASSEVAGKSRAEVLRMIADRAGRPT